MILNMFGRISLILVYTFLIPKEFQVSLPGMISLFDHVLERFDKSLDLNHQAEDKILILDILHYQCSMNESFGTTECY